MSLMIAGVILVPLCKVQADGYRNPPPTAEGIGKSGVNSVFVNDASAISYNPANLALQTNASLVVAVTLARTENRYSPPIPGASFESDGDWNVLPDIYYSQPLGESGIAVGLGITAPYGQGISWNKSDFSLLINGPAPVPYDASILFLNINPTIAMQLTDAISIGAGADIVYSELELNALFPLGVPPIDAKGDGEGWGVGGNVGVTWQVADAHRITATYRSRVDVDYEGDFSLGGDFETTVKYPNIVGFGYGVQVTDDIRVEALLEWLEWSINDTQSLEIGGIPSAQQNDWDDTITVGVGGDWQFDDNWVMRAGYAFIESPIPDSTITPLLPDADRHAFSLGLGYTVGSHAVDVAYTFSIYDDRSSPLTGTAPGTYDIDSDLIGMTYSFNF